MRTIRSVKAIAALGCVVALWKGSPEFTPDEGVRVVEVCEVLRNLEEFDGKEVTLIGAVHENADPDSIVDDPASKSLIFDRGCDLRGKLTGFSPALEIMGTRQDAPWQPPKVARTVIEHLLAGNPGCSVIAVRGRIELMNDPSFWVDPTGKRWPRKKGIPMEEPARIRSNGVTFLLALPAGK